MSQPKIFFSSWPKPIAVLSLAEGDEVEVPAVAAPLFIAGVVFWKPLSDQRISEIVGNLLEKGAAFFGFFGNADTAACAHRVADVLREKVPLNEEHVIVTIDDHGSLDQALHTFFGMAIASDEPVYSKIGAYLLVSIGASSDEEALLRELRIAVPSLVSEQLSHQLFEGLEPFR